LVEKALQGHYEVLPLPGSTQLIEALRTRPADLVLLTVSGTGVDGFRKYDIIRRIPEMEERPVIFISDGSDSKTEQKMLSKDAMDYITLPITEELLLHRVNNAVELAELRRERPYVEKYQDAISISFAELVECRDETTGGHLKKTTGYFNILLRAAMNSDAYKDRIAPEDVGALLRSASLHDIGKIGINDDILRKDSSLNYSEYENMKTHTTLGKQTFEKIIKETGGTGWLYLAKDIAYCHHEHWDGSGYPNGLKGEEIPLYARMLTLADVYDALTSRRSYKEAFSHRVATDIIIKGKGSIFDPGLVDLFIKKNREFEEMLSR
jgi:putative two-component system response regulator